MKKKTIRIKNENNKPDNRKKVFQFSIGTLIFIAGSVRFSFSGAEQKNIKLIGCERKKIKFLESF